MTLFSNSHFEAGVNSSLTALLRSNHQRELCEYQFFLEIHTPRKPFLVNYMALALGLDVPIVEAITIALLNNNDSTKSIDKAYHKLKTFTFDIRIPISKKINIIDWKGSGSYYQTFRRIDIESLSWEEIKEWFLKTHYNYSFTIPLSQSSKEFAKEFLDDKKNRFSITEHLLDLQSCFVYKSFLD